MTWPSEMHDAADAIFNSNHELISVWVILIVITVESVTIISPIYSWIMLTAASLNYNSSLCIIR